MPQLIDLIDSNYRFSFFLDNLPIAASHVTTGGTTQFLPGCEVGFISARKHFIDNELAYTIYLNGQAGLSPSRVLTSMAQTATQTRTAYSALRMQSHSRRTNPSQTASQ
jgi:hypothetical protein